MTGLRRATARDAGPVTAVLLAARAVAMPWLPDLHTDEETAGFVRDVVLPGCDVHVATGPDGAVVGFAARRGPELEHLYVHPGAQGRGVGSALLRQAMADSPAGLTLFVFQANTAARAFYERHGFRVLDADDTGERNEEHLPDLRYRWPQGAD
ncbi:GNAT family N-acetyltransferase [Modestobacter sp. NPDC049651]|uniref:GNAT family N-acetyltransferase n=1 Tax=unclassified Modestobacter TaxID=2643866 RepID=UPI0033C8632C